MKLRKLDERFEKGVAATIAAPISEGGTMTREFTCELDGLVLRAENDEDLVAQVERHIAEAHAELVGKLSRDDILAKVGTKVEVD
jgi:hypothetical protein